MESSIAFKMTFEGVTMLSIDLLNVLGAKEVSIIESTGANITWEQYKEKVYWTRCEIVVLEKIQLKIEECSRRMRVKQLHEINVKFSKTEVDVLVRNFPIQNSYGHIGVLEMYKHSHWGNENQKRLGNNGKTIIQP